MKRNEFQQSEFEDQENWEQKELENNPDRATDDQIISGSSMDLVERARQRNLEKLKTEGIGYSKDPDKRNSDHGKK